MCNADHKSEHVSNQYRNLDFFFFLLWLLWEEGFFYLFICSFVFSKHLLIIRTCSIFIILFTYIPNVTPCSPILSPRVLLPCPHLLPLCHNFPLHGVACQVSGKPGDSMIPNPFSFTYLENLVKRKILSSLYASVFPVDLVGHPIIWFVQSKGPSQLRNLPSSTCDIENDSLTFSFLLPWGGWQVFPVF